MIRRMHHQGAVKGFYGCHRKHGKLQNRWVAFSIEPVQVRLGHVDTKQPKRQKYDGKNSSG